MRSFGSSVGVPGRGSGNDMSGVVGNGPTDRLILVHRNVMHAFVSRRFSTFRGFRDSGTLMLALNRVGENSVVRTYSCRRRHQQAG